MCYTYAYTSPASNPNPVVWELTLSQAANLTSLAYMAAGRKWNEEDKQLFKNPYSQFVKVETDLTKLWRLNSTSQLAAHLSAGAIYCYGNSAVTPFSESFYVGGANSIRAFPVRSIGPGRFVPDGDAQYSFLVQNGDIKFVANLEYRTRLFGNLGGAIFLDAGNVWRWNDPVFTLDDLKEMVSEEEYSHYDDATKQKIIDYMNDWFSGWAPRSSTIIDQIALGTGVGLRYDLGFLVIRIDWGLALHMPYKTNRSGYFNVDSFRDAQTLHFAVGYPF
jgi:outer membrane protein assembly factor BamA